jgi:ABC-type Fe3+-siderophore transport system permease subunit
MFIALEIGIILGSASTLIFYDNSKHTILISFLIGALLSLVAALYLIWHIRTKKSIY